jgi:hypothetical protein
MEFIFTDILNKTDNPNKNEINNSKKENQNVNNNNNDSNNNNTFNKNFDKEKISFIYKFKKISNNQKIFIKSFIQKVLNNEPFLYEFPPTLDKTFLICSSLISLLNYEKEKLNINSRNPQNSHTKYLLLVKNEDLIFEAINNFKEISEISKILKKEKLNQIQNHNNNQIYNQIVPFFDKKFFCINEKSIEKMSPIDFESFCGSQINSWINHDDKCGAFKVK